MPQITTTLNRIFAHGPCKSGWKKLLRYLDKTGADDDPLPFSVILNSNGIDDALWCCRAEPQHDRLWRLYAVWCARQVQHLMKDTRSVAALDVAERYANGGATDDELNAARAAARAASMFAAWTAAWTAARVAAGAASMSAAWTAAWAVSRVASGAASWDAARDVQAAKFREIVENGEWS